MKKKKNLCGSHTFAVNTTHVVQREELKSTKGELKGRKNISKLLTYLNNHLKSVFDSDIVLVPSEMPEELIAAPPPPRCHCIIMGIEVIKYLQAALI